MKRMFFIKWCIFIFFVGGFCQISFAQEVDSEQDDIGNLPTIVELSGAHLRAVLIAYEAFKNESSIPDKKRLIENYQIQVKQNKDKFYIFFDPNVAEGEDYQFGGETSLGKEVYYIIDKKTLRILGRYFMR